MLERTVLKTADGSHTLRIPAWDEQYHSVHGAVQESRHVFIEAGLQAVSASEVRILEMGFGTGLNALLTWNAVAGTDRVCRYDTLEKFPLAQEEIAQLNYPAAVGGTQSTERFAHLHEAAWEQWTSLDPTFYLRKQEMSLHEWQPDQRYDLVYYDAFGPRVQPELWTAECFAKIREALEPGALLVTYCAKGDVRRALQHVGFTVERLPGPPGKREMIRARV